MQRKKNLVGNQLRVLIFLLVSECILLLLSLIMGRIGNFRIPKYGVEVQAVDMTFMHQKGVFCAGIQLFNVLPYNIEILKHDIRVLQPTLKGYLQTHPFYCLVEFASIDGL